MKSKEVIRQLQNLDPSGEIEVCVSNQDIFSIDILPAYYDGRLQVFTYHPKDPYQIVGARYVTSGQKISILSQSITDLISEDPDVEIDYSSLGDRASAYREQHEKTRALTRHIDRKHELRTFQEWAEGKARVILPDYSKSGLYHQAERFYDQHFDPKDPLPEMAKREHKDGYSYWPSIHERRCYQYDCSVELTWSGLDFEFKLSTET